MKKNDIVTGICSGYTNEGYGVVKIDGFPLFVKGLIRDEEAILHVLKVNKGYGFGKIKELLKESKERVTPPCSLFQKCGGCQLQHMSAKEQAYFKHNKVEEVMRRIGKTNVKVDTVLPMAYPYAYRNKGQVPVGVDVYGKVVCGFYRMNSNDIIDMDHCMIQSDLINKCIQVMKEGLQKLDCGRYFRHILVKHAFSNDTIMLVWIVREKTFPHMDELKTYVLEKLPMVKSIVLNLNQRNDNVILGREETVLYGENMIYDELNGITFGISSKSFYQVNPVQTKVLYGKALEYAQLTGNETVLDLYCGVGTISLFLAKHAKSVIGIEIVEDAVINAKENAKLNDITNVDFVCSDAASYADKLAKSGTKLDVVVVDPPRKGCDTVTLDSIITMDPKRIVYVSCDPATLARDVHYLEERGYRCVKVTPCDMFCGTAHVETVCLLSKLNVKKHINVKLDLDDFDLTSAESKATYQEIKKYILDR